MSYLYIYNPVNQSYVNLNSMMGKYVLHNYIQGGGAVVFDAVRKCLGCENEEEKATALLNYEQDERNWHTTNLAPYANIGNIRPGLNAYGFTKQGKEEYDGAMEGYHAANSSIRFHHGPVGARTRQGLKRLHNRHPGAAMMVQEEMDRW